MDIALILRAMHEINANQPTTNPWIAWIAWIAWVAWIAMQPLDQTRCTCTQTGALFTTS